MSFAQLSAFTVSDDHERQVTIWNSLASWNRDPHSIRRALTEEMIPATDKRVQFIGGLAAYEEAGGSVTFVFLDYYGRLAIERGFVKPGEVEAAGNEDEDGEGLPSASSVRNSGVWQSRRISEP
ncbi:hypothetical protein RWA02_32805 (plasmid) [Sinorhizobium meliloti]|uniref:hypothetical protein n=1 Tax=Rhizobium meliloti TaxID=382 RepID=UPI00299E514A